MRIFVPPDSRLMLITNYRQMKCSFTTENKFDCKFRHLQALKKVMAKCKANYLSWTVICCNSWYLLVLNFKCSRRILCDMFNCQATCLINCMSANISRLNFVHLNFSDVSPPRVFSTTNATSLINQFSRLVNRRYYWWLLARHHMKSPLHGSRRRLIRNYTIVSGAFQVQTFENSNRTKLFLCLISSALSHEDELESWNIAPPFLTSTLDGCELSAD
jgi:hypothetical protein